MNNVSHLLAHWLLDWPLSWNWDAILKAGGSCGGIVALTALLLKLRDERAVRLRNEKKRKFDAEEKLSNTTRMPGLHETDIIYHSDHYEPPHIGELNPSQPDAKAVPDTRTAIEYVRAFVEDDLPGRPHHWLIVTNRAGMGKSALLCEYAKDNERAEQHHKILFVRLNHDTSLVSTTLRDYPAAERGSTVALLDGLDEDTEIQSDRWRARIIDLVKNCDGFRKVIITSRPEYYEKVYEELSPQLTQLLARGAAGSREQLRHVTLFKFTNVQIGRILAGHFPYRAKMRSFYRTWRYRKIAWKFIKLVADPAFRPMVFNDMVDLVLGVEKEQRGLASTASEDRDLWYVYRTIVGNWMDREEKKIANPHLNKVIQDISRRLALSIHLEQSADSMEFISDKDLRTPSQESERFVTDEQLKGVLKALGVTADDKTNVMERSLLRRTGTKWFFAHESIGWYLFIEQFLRLPFDKRDLVKWEPLMKQLVLGCIRRRDRKEYAFSYAYCSLAGEKLTGYNLNSADFRNANLTGCNLRGSDCKGANFCGATLDRADFTGAQLEGANFEGAKTDGALNWQPHKPRLGPFFGRFKKLIYSGASSSFRGAGGAARMMGKALGMLMNVVLWLPSILWIPGWFRFLAGFFSNDIGIDLGTANIMVYVKDHGIVLREPSVVAVKAGTNKVLAVGNEAKRMLGRSPVNVSAIRPLKDGVIADYVMIEAMLRHFITKVHNRAKWVRPRVVIAVPSGITEVEKRAVKESATRAGAREVYLIEEPMAAAIGVGLPVQDAAGNMIIHTGDGTTEVALISLSGIVFSRSVRVGSNELNKAIVNYVKRAYNLMIGERTAEEIKIKIGSVFPPDHEDKETSMEVKGRDLVAGLPKTLIITSQEIREALMEPINDIVESVRITLERCPPELAVDLMDRGMVLAGGAALLRGLDELLKKETGLPVHVAEDPLSAVAEGTGKVLSEIKFLRQVASSDQSWR